MQSGADGDGARAVLGYPLRVQRAPVASLARTPEEWAEALRPIGGRPFHARQLFRWVHERGVLDPQRMTDLPGPVRGALSALDLEATARVAAVHRSSDRTRKLLLQLRDGATVETVLIPAVSGGGPPLPSPLIDEDAAVDDDDSAGDASDGAMANDSAVSKPADGAVDGVSRVRVTQCVSSQVGCAMGCVFCASGVAGLKRHLGADEIVAQVVVGRSHLDPDETLTNVVFMGMGEPLHNYEATARALQLLTHPGGMGLSARRITVSTSGLVPEIARLGGDFRGTVGLAVSLHAADDETRSRLMPINKKYPLAQLMNALRAYPLPRRRRITIEYTLVEGKNDGAANAKKLVRLLRGIPVKVNLIPMNPIGASSLGPPDLKNVLAFQRVLCDEGYSCFIRKRRGDDVSAACGQLAILGAKPKVRVNRG
jgi:23S rRNA (adenine2503-C2)-methyltransferase